MDTMQNITQNTTLETAKIYGFKTESLKGEDMDMASFKGKVLLIVNTASKCGYTPQYADLQTLHERYSDKGLIIIGFPCNQFGGQEPGDATQISENCLINYGVSFIMAKKVDVIGDNADPIFTYLQDALPGILDLKFIKWNFTKFLIAKDGTPFKRFAPATGPLEMEKDILELLG
jgi:glutathione peroxidase